jgi:hypothetical protein
MLYEVLRLGDVVGKTVHAGERDDRRPSRPTLCLCGVGGEESTVSCRRCPWWRQTGRCGPVLCTDDRFVTTSKFKIINNEYGTLSLLLILRIPYYNRAYCNNRGILYYY